MARRSRLEALLAAQIRAKKWAPPEEEYRFSERRRFRFDFAYPAAMLGIEVEGGTWTGGRHVTGKGFEKDCEKYNLAAVEGWTVLRFTAEMIEDGRAIDTIEHYLVEASKSRVSGANG